MLIHKLHILRPQLKGISDPLRFEIRDDGSGPRIVSWPSDVPTVTDEELASVTTTQLTSYLEGIAAAETAERERQVILRGIRAYLQTIQDDKQEDRRHIKYIEQVLSARFPGAFQPPAWRE